ncbi:MAG: transcriptional repressor [Candidatus Marinamargulisbacteria bacterium]|nr:transcriptional repressor [Candidatus Marinamargulisbacteria bacterium]
MPSLYFDRKTPVSTAILALFESSNRPLSLKLILDHLKHQGLLPNKTTVYRILDKLLAARAIAEVNVRTGRTYYEKVQGHLHYHFFCIDCESIFCLEPSHTDTLIESMKAANPSFTINDHDLNLYGQCGSCPSNTSTP